MLGLFMKLSYNRYTVREGAFNGRVDVSRSDSRPGYRGKDFWLTRTEKE